MARKRARLALFCSLFPQSCYLIKLLRSLLSNKVLKTILKCKDKNFRRFLNGTIIGLHKECLEKIRPEPLRITSMNEVVRRTVRKLVHANKFRANGANLLTRGFRPATEGAQTGFDGIEVYYPNSLLEFYNKPHWKMLLEFIGDDVMGMILESSTIFTKLPSGAYLQISGGAIDVFPRPAESIKPNTSGFRVSRYQTIYSKRKRSNHLTINLDDICYTSQIFCKFTNMTGLNAAIKAEFDAVTSQMLLNQRKCPYTTLRDTLDPIYREKTWPEFGPDEPPLTFDGGVMKYASEYSNVEKFCLVCLKKVMPRFFSSKKYFIGYLKEKISCFVRLRRFESFGWEALGKGLKVSELTTGISSSRSAALQAKLAFYVQSFVCWIFSDYLVKLLRSVYYITDTGMHRNRMFYFRHDVWNQLTRPFYAQLKSSLFVPIRPGDFDRSKASLCSLRLVPKGDTFRPIMSMKSNGQAWSKTMLKDLHAILTCIIKTTPKLLGSSVLGYDEIANRLAKFRQNRLVLQNKFVYMVKVDFKACFDSIPQAKLLHLLAHKIIPREDFTIQKYDVIKNIHGKNSVSYKRRACPTGNFTTVANLMSAVRSGSLRILVDQVTGWTIEHATILKNLQEHICGTVIEIEGEIWGQKVGIPQGSILSSLLCSLLYGDMDVAHLAEFMEDPESLMMRYIDDMIFLTTSYELASSFIEKISPGFPDYGITCNMEKLGANFFHPQIAHKIPATERFPWCGLLLCQDQLHVNADYGKFIGTYISNALSIQRASKIGEAFKRQLKIFLKPRLKKIYLCPELNSKEVITTNVYENFVFSAIKIHAYLKQLRRDNGITFRLDFLLEALEDSFEFAHSVARKVCGPGSGLPVRWLGYQAMHRVFAHKGTPEHVELTLELARRCRFSRAEEYSGVIERGDTLIRNILF